MPVITEKTPIQFRDELPAAVDVAIVGGGIAGVMTAWFLQRAGKRVLICEKGRIAGEQSCRNWGFVRQAGRHAAELPIMMECMDTWQALQDEIGDEVGFRRPGSLFISQYDEELSGYAAWVEKVAKPHGLPSRMIDAKAVRALLNLPESEFKGGLYTERDGCAEPFTAIPAVARCLHAKGGVAIRENCATRCLDIEGGRVVGIHTEAGRVRSEQVLVAAGLWSSRLLGNHGLRFPQLAVNTTLGRTEPVNDLREIVFGSTQACFRPRVDGGYTLTPGEIMEHELCFDTFRYGRQFLPALLSYRRHSSITLGRLDGLVRRLFPKRKWAKEEKSPFEEVRVLDPELSSRHFSKIPARMAQCLPPLAQLKIVEAWTGSADMTPDMLPALGEVKRHPGLHIASGLSGHGFGIGPGVGKVVADGLLGNTPKFDLSAFEFERFSRGAKLESDASSAAQQQA